MAERGRAAARRTNPRSEDEGPVGLVVAGAGARGAYEAGVLSMLLPAIEKTRRPTVFVGTSAGAINAALFASLAHLPVEVAVTEALDRWRSINKHMVIKPAWRSMPSLVARSIGGMFGLASQPASLLDTAPLGRSLNAETLLDWEQIAANLADGTVQALAVVTTEFQTGRTKVFYDGPRGALRHVPKSDDERAVDYVRGRITADHVRASAAIPIVFPPVRLGPGSNASWHMDGGVRLNAPLKPAITLGARRLVVVATDPPYYTPSSKAAGPRHPPSIQEAADHLMRGAMSDRMIEDLITLSHLNTALASGTAGGTSRTGRTLHRIEFVFGGPMKPSTLGSVAGGILDRMLRGTGRLRHPDLALIDAMLRGGRKSRGDLVSYLFFEPEFMEAAIELGQRDAQAILRHGPLWKESHFPPKAKAKGRGRPRAEGTRGSRPGGGQRAVP